MSLVGRRVVVIGPETEDLRGKRGDCVGYENGRYLVSIAGEPYTFAPDEIREVGWFRREVRRALRLGFMRWFFGWPVKAVIALLIALVIYKLVTR